MADLPGWPWWKVISITGQSGAGTDYQVKFEIGDSAGGNVHLEGHCTNFPQDIRITDDDGTTLLDHWVEDLTADPIVVHVEVKDDLGSNQDIRVYYGKSGETTASDGTATFIAYHGTASTEFHDTNLATPPFIYEAKVKQTSGSEYVMWGLGETGELDAAPGDAISLMTYATGNNRYLKCWNDGTQFAPNDTPHFTINQWYKNKITIASSSSAKLWTEGYGTDLEATINIPNEIMGLAMQFTSGTGEQEYSFVRKYNSPEPAFSSAGAEQSAAGVSPTAVFYGPFVGPLGGPL